MRTRLLALLVPLIALSACHQAPDPNPLELHIYDVPKGTARALNHTLQDAFWSGDASKNQSIGHPSITPDGRLLVLAPANIQANVQTLIDGVAKQPPVARGQLVELRYWFLLAKPAATPQPSPPGVGDIQPALDEIIRSQGPQTFTIGHMVRLSSMDQDDWAVTKSDDFEVKQRLIEVDDGSYFELDLRYSKDVKLQTHVRLTPDRIVVLGAVGPNAVLDKATPDTTLYYVVRLAPSAQPKP
jgi:hypothetical protein